MVICVGVEVEVARAETGLLFDNLCGAAWYFFAIDDSATGAAAPSCTFFKLDHGDWRLPQ